MVNVSPFRIQTTLNATASQYGIQATLCNFQSNMTYVSLFHYYYNYYYGCNENNAYEDSGDDDDGKR